MKLKLLLFIIFALFLCIPSITFAQVESEDLESCFKYYDYGEVKANFETEKSSYSSGEIAKINGTIVNNNNFPLLDVILYAHVKRVNDTDTYLQNGHFLIDRIILAEDLSFLPGETKGINIDLPISPNYPNGNYQLHYFLFSKHGFHYAGRPFLEEDVAGYSTFKIVNGIDPVVYFDIDSLIVNGQPHTIREFISEFPASTLSFQVNLVNNLETASRIPVEVKWYKFEDNSEENLINTQQMIINPQEKVFQTFFNPQEPGAYIILLEINKPVRSLFKYRFAVAGEMSSELRMNDLGVTNFPATGDDRAWVCFHSPTDSNSPDTQVTLTVMDSNKKVVEEKTISRVFAREVRAISVPFNNLSTPSDFWIKAHFSQVSDSSSFETVEVHYECSKFSSSLKSLDATFDNTKTAISLEGKDGCGNAVRAGGYIESIKIKDSKGEIKTEKYNLASIPKQFPLDSLLPGTYDIEIKSGNITEKFNFNIPPLAAKKEKKGINIWMLLLILTLIFLTVGIYLYKKYKGVKESVQ